MTLDMVIGIVHIFSTMVHMLIDLRAMHSFRSCKFIARVGVTPVPLYYHMNICIPVGESLWPIQVLKRGLFYIEG